MIFFPFRRRVYKTTLSFDEIFKRLQKGISTSNSQTGTPLEMTQGQESFIIGKTTEKKPGLMDTLPVAKGRLKKEGTSTYATITIKPRTFLLPVISLLVAIPAIYFGVTQFDFLTFTLAVLLLVMMYSDLIAKFNRLYKVYAETLDSVFEGVES